VFWIAVDGDLMVVVLALGMK
jgi:hypothetical protein